MASDDRPRRDIGKLRVSIARHLRDIEQLALDLHAQALNTPNAKDWPGGDALAMLAPAVSPQDWEAEYERKEAEQRWAPDGTDRWVQQHMKPDAERPLSNWQDPAVYQSEADAAEQPLNVLCFWTRVIREERDQPTSLKPTLSREVDYIRKSLDWVTRQDEWSDPEWPLVFELAEELRVLVRRMEDVLRMGVRSDRIKAECWLCDEHPRLLVKYGSVPRADWWKCPACRVDYDEDGVRECWRKMLVRRGTPPEWLPLRRAAAAIGRPVSTVRSWTLPRFGKPPKVESKPEPDRGFTLVRWSDVRAAEETTHRRRRSVA